jgi:hypothetical protein
MDTKLKATNSQMLISSSYLQTNLHHVNKKKKLTGNDIVQYLGDMSYDEQ